MQQLEQTKVDCIVSCQQAYGACMKAIVQCLQPEHTRLLLDCAEAAQVSANFLLRDSPSAGYICGVCARLCERCAAACEGLDDLRECARTCREAAVLCQQMGKVPPEGICVRGEFF